MKEPSEHKPETWLPYGSDEEMESCVKCGWTWPCPKWEKWLDSADYALIGLKKQVYRLQDRISTLEGAQHVHEKLLWGLTVPALKDLADHGRLGETEIDWVSNGGDISVDSLLSVTRIPETREFTVTYHSVNGAVWKNGKVVSQGYWNG